MEHSELVRSLAKSGETIVDEITPNKAHLLHMSGCVCEEAGEVFGKVKKHIFYNKKLDIEALIEEMGDLEFYLEGLRQGLGITREAVLESNIVKLTKRYSSGSYSDKDAINRADKK